MIAVRWLVVAAALTACSRSGTPDAERGAASPPAGAAAGRTARTAPGLASGGGSAAASNRAGAADTAGRPEILFLGTSLTAGLGLDPAQAYPALIQDKLDSAGMRWRVVNGGVSGETSAGALRRLGWVLGPGIRVLVIETGANDGLRGLDVDSTRANIDSIVRRSRATLPGVRIVLAGMEAPPNLGPAYTTRFRALFPELARRQRLRLIPFLLAGVGGVDSLNQADGIHPNTAGARIVAANVWSVLLPVLRERTP